MAKITVAGKRASHARRATAARSAKAVPRRRAATAPTPISVALSRTVDDAQQFGHALGAAGLTLAKGTVRLAYDVTAVVALAGKSVVDGTAAFAGGIVRRAEALVGPEPALDARKPLRSVRSRRAAGGQPDDAHAAATA